MSEPTFEDVRDELFRLYHAGDYAAAYELITREAPRLPGHDSRMLYWRACLANRVGKPDEALAALQQALDADHWYGETWLRGGDDLRSLHGDPRFEALVEAFRARQSKAQAAAKPQLAVLPPKSGTEPHPLLLALHGAGSTMGHMVPYWKQARRNGWWVAVPQSSQVSGPATFGWDDRALAARELQDHLAAITAQFAVDPQRIVVGGFSQGGGLAPWLALSGVIDAAGFIAVAPYIADLAELATLIAQAAPTLRGYIVVGDQDINCLPLAQQLHERMRAAGLACAIEVHPGVSHEFPPDWAQSLARALAFVMADK